MDRPSEKTTTWTSDELSRIEAAQELEIAPRRRDRTLRRPVPIWVVRVGADLYVRAAYGSASGWHRVAQASREGRISAGGVDKDVTIDDAEGAVNDQVDVAYRTKYRRYSASIVDGITNGQARSSTLRLAANAPVWRCCALSVGVAVGADEAPSARGARDACPDGGPCER